MKQPLVAAVLVGVGAGLIAAAAGLVYLNEDERARLQLQSAKPLDSDDVPESHRRILAALALGAVGSAMFASGGVLAASVMLPRIGRRPA